MAVLTQLDEEELYLAALLDDGSGLDLAEFCWTDEEKDDGCYRCWDFQWPLYRCDDSMQIDQMARSLGKTIGIQMRSFAHPFAYPGAERLLTAPELNHLRPVCDGVENRLLNVRLARELLPKVKGLGIARQPQWQVRFVNNARIISRLPKSDGKGVKGQHPLQLELDEAQDYPLAGWIELIETLKHGVKGFQWRAHGVSRGVRDKYYELTQAGSGWRVHRYTAMYRPTWSDAEREQKIKDYGGSRDNPDYKRNILGEHGDATNPLFVLARLMACVNMDAEHNEDVYALRKISYELLTRGQIPIESLLQLPGGHKDGYRAYWAGMDVGFTNHPSEILIGGLTATKPERLRILCRINLQRIDAEDQMRVIYELFKFYGAQLKGFALDKTGNGLPIWQLMLRHAPPDVRDRIFGYNFSEKIPVEFADREPVDDETLEDLAVLKNVIEYGSDTLRDWVDQKRIELPFDRELLAEWQGQTYTIVRTTTNPYGQRSYSKGKFHTLDAGKMLISVMTLERVRHAIAVDLANRAKKKTGPVLDVFLSG